MNDMMFHLARKHFERGRQYELQGRTVDAVAAYEQAVGLEQPLAKVYFHLGRIHATNGRYRQAVALLDQAVELEPDTTQHREWRGYVRGRLRRYEEALADYRAVEETGDRQVKVNVGRMLLALRRYEEAEDALEACKDDKSAGILLDALPRYREFWDEYDRTDDHRGVRYLFGRTMVVGTLNDYKESSSRYLLLSYPHLGLTLRRFLHFVKEQGWTFDAVAGSGPAHRAVAEYMGRALGLPFRDLPGPGKVLLCSAVVEGGADAKKLATSWRKRGQVMHFALGMIPKGDPNAEEPEVVGYVGRCAVPWHRVQTYSRL